MVNLTIRIPRWLERVCVWPALIYRKIRYGCVFRRIYLGEGLYTVVDPEDYYRLCKYHWGKDGNGDTAYAVRLKRNKNSSRILIYMHREIMKPPKGRLIDHKNNIPSDNRKSNLRTATQAQNLRHRRKIRRKTSSRYIGVYYRSNRKRWAVQIDYRGKTRWVGSFTDEVEAAKARDKAALKYHGDFAILNFPTKESIANCLPRRVFGLRD